ncbi:MAG: tetratricopeptide repeat protein [gamma proteobacterium symbiont of Bathyaustriella thionipta]|nr:tetratricopeptide repeat protein [gamma proteobacterium symbiont of Bathyaustriella thionipta]
MLFSFQVMADAAQDLVKEGNRLWSENKISQAEKIFRQAIEKQPELVSAHSSLAGLLMTTNRNKEAIEEYQAAIMLDSENAHLYMALALAYLHEQKFSMSQAMANEALRIDPQLKGADKLIEYIDKKQEVIKQASAVEIAPQETASAK